MLYSWISLQIVSFSIDYQLTIFNYIWTMLHIVTLCSTIVAVFCMPQWCFTMVDLKIVWICLNTHSIFHICGIDIYIYIYLYGNDIKICGGRARPRGPGGSIKYQFVYLNVVTVYIHRERKRYQDLKIHFHDLKTWFAYVCLWETLPHWKTKDLVYWYCLAGIVTWRGGSQTHFI